MTVQGKQRGTSKHWQSKQPVIASLPLMFIFRLHLHGQVNTTAGVNFEKELIRAVTICERT
jgi:hypothetical protein